MKKITTLIAALLVVLAASATEPQSKKSVKPIELTKATFLEKVFNYENNPEEWLYNGDKPAGADPAGLPLPY